MYSKCYTMSFSIKIIIHNSFFLFIVFGQDEKKKDFTQEDIK